MQRKKKEREQERKDGGDSSLEKAERLRAKVEERVFIYHPSLLPLLRQERATLKHTHSSKWAKEQLAKKHRDPSVSDPIAGHVTVM